MYNNWYIKIGDRLHNPTNDKTYLILSEQGDDFFCLEYKEKDKTYAPIYLSVEREFFYKLFHLIDGLNAEQTIFSPEFKDNNFYISKTSIYTDDSLGVFKFYPTFQEVVQLLRNISYIQNPEIVAEELIAKGRVWIDSTFLIEIKEY